MNALESGGRGALLDAVKPPADVAMYGDEKAEIEPILKILVGRDSPEVFHRFCQVAQVSDIGQWQSYLGKPVKLRVEDLPVALVFEHLKDHVRLPVWFDESIKENDTAITLDVSGTWIEVLDAAATAAELQVASFDEQLLWVEPDELRAAAEVLYRKSRSRIPTRDFTMAQSLLERTKTTFEDTLITKVCEYFGDLHDVNVHFQWRSHPKATKPQVDFQGKGLPLHLAWIPIALI